MDSRTSVHLEETEAEIGLGEYVRALWHRRRLVLGSTLVTAVLAGAIAWVIPKSYEVTVLVMPVSESPSGGQLGGLSSLASQFGGLASLAGISVGENSHKVESVAVLQSEALTEMFIRQNNLLPALFKSKWDPEAKAWKDSRPGKIPTPWKGYQLFKNIRQVNQNAKTGLVTLTVDWTSPEVAAAWANGLVKLTNEYLRDQAIRASERNIAYLNEEAAKTNIVEARQAIYTLLATELNRQMMARGSEQYGLKVIDAAVPPELPTFPKKTVWVLIGAALGLIFSSGFVLMRADFD
jgi:uncharacterized protein involved in exopolysaccharide biosynthesis